MDTHIHNYTKTYLMNLGDLSHPLLKKNAARTSSCRGFFSSSHCHLARGQKYDKPLNMDKMQSLYNNNHWNIEKTVGALVTHLSHLHLLLKMSNPPKSDGLVETPATIFALNHNGFV